MIAPEQLPRWMWPACAEFGAMPLSVTVTFVVSPLWASVALPVTPEFSEATSAAVPLATAPGAAVVGAPVVGEAAPPAGAVPVVGEAAPPAGAIPAAGAAAPPAGAGPVTAGAVAPPVGWRIAQARNCAVCESSRSSERRT